LVDDVDQFEGHIACDAETKSEIVLPIIKDGIIYGVLDIDSTIYSRFDKIEMENLENLLNLLVEQSNIEELSRIYQQS